jgi:MFS family permease
LSYLSEFRLNWTNLLGAGLGLGFGTAFNHYIMNVFGPALIADLGWTKAQFALVGSIGLVGMAFTPVAGRITDRIGPRNAAIVGFTAIPLAYLALSFMSGNIYEFYTILALKFMFGILTATMVFTRVVVERFDRARGIAMACLLSCPPAIGAISAPIMGGIIEAEGWRFAYRVMAAVTATGGLLAIVLIGKYMDAAGTLRPPAPKLDWAHFRELCRNRVFLLLMAGMFLVNFPQPLVSSQMNIMLMENGATMGFATALVSVYAISVVIGRFIGGFALDRVKPHFVAIVSLGLPALGFVALASSFDVRWILAGSMALVGLAQGAETDVAAILTSRRFDMGHYSFVFSLLMTSMGLASSLGSILLSITLQSSGNFNTFLYICAGVTLLGALCFFMTGSAGVRHDRLLGESS